MGEQDAENNPDLTLHREAARRVLNFFKIRVLDGPSTRLTEAIRPMADRLEEEGAVESTLEPAALEDSRHPRRRLYRLVEPEPIELAA